MNSNRINDPFEPTPPGFHLRVESKLAELQCGLKARRRRFRLAAVLAACLVLATGTALALDQLGVLYFLTERDGREVASEAITQPLTQGCDSALLDATLRDAYWDGETLSISINVHPKDAGAAFYTETDVGTDGENFDKIWWKGEIIPFDEWRAGREVLELKLPTVKASVPSRLISWDWVQDGQGETLMIQMEADDLTHGADLTVTLTTRVLDTEATETATLTATLPAMKAEPQKEED